MPLIFVVVIKMSLGPGEMVQGLSVFAALPEDLRLFPAPMYDGSQPFVNSSFWGPGAIFWSSWVLTCMRSCVPVCVCGTGETQRSRVKGHLQGPRGV